MNLERSFQELLYEKRPFFANKVFTRIDINEPEYLGEVTEIDRTLVIDGMLYGSIKFYCGKYNKTTVISRFDIDDPDQKMFRYMSTQ